MGAAACKADKQRPVPEGTDVPPEGGDNSLTGLPAKAEEQPLLEKIGRNLPGGKLKDYEMTFDATSEQQAKADIVISWHIEEEDEEAAVSKDAMTVEVDELESKRRDLLQRLTVAGLDYCSMKSADGDECFVLITAHQDRLMECAEFNRHELPLKKSWQAPATAFTIDRKDDFVHEDPKSGRIFSTRDRQTLIMEILEQGSFSQVDEMRVNPHLDREWRRKHGKPKSPTCGLNLDEYVSDGVLTGYFALHGHGRRFELIEKWGYKPLSPQPLDMIWEYFNSKTAIYFAFIGYYTWWLVMSAAAGCAVLVWESVTTKKNGTGDSTAVTIFSLYMAFWGTLFLEFWKRYNAELAYRWSTTGLEQESKERHEYKRHCGEVTRQGFYSSQGHFIPYDEELEPPSSCTDRLMGGYWPLHGSDVDIEDPVLKEKITQIAPPHQPYMEPTDLEWRRRVNNSIAVTFLVSVVMLMSAFLVMRLVFQKMIDAQMGGILASVVQATATVGLNLVYQNVAIWMVEYENHRTTNEYEDALVYKVYGFQFINSYFTLFYVAFVKGNIGSLYGMHEVCKAPNGKPADNCMEELGTLLLGLLLTTQLASTVAEMAVPYFQYKALLWAEQAKYKLRTQGTKDEGTELQHSDIDHESKLTPCHVLDAFTDYNKMALQYGYVSMFCAAFPLAPFCALLNNFIEIRTDSLKRLIGMQRPAPSERAEDIGAWMQILEIQSMIAVATNIGVLCFTSDRLTKTFGLDTTQRVWAFILLEHVVVLCKMFMAQIIDDVPEWVTLRLARDSYMLACRDEIIWKEQETATTPRPKEA